MLAALVRRRLAGLLVAVLGCGDDAGSAAASDSSSTGSADGGETGAIDDGVSIDDVFTPPLRDLPEESRSCEDRGARFGIVAGPKQIETQSNATTIQGIGLAASASDLFATFAAHGDDGSANDFLGVRLSPDGKAKGSPWSLSVSSDEPRTHVRDDGLLLTYCTDGIVGWRAFDVSGSSLGPELLSPTYAACNGDAPAAAWTDIGYLVAWHAAPSIGCPDGCLALAFGSESVVFRTDPLRVAHVVTDPLAVAVADRAALVVASHVSEQGDNELAMSLVETGGAALFPPLVHTFPSAAGAGPQAQAPVAAAPTGDDGFVVIVGGRGAAYGRLRLNDIASAEGEFEEVPLPPELSGYDAFRHDVTAVRRTGGLVVYGRATEGEGDDAVDGLLVSMLDDQGEMQSFEFFSGAKDGAVATSGGRTWIAYGGAGLYFAELGCVL